MKKFNKTWKVYRAKDNCSGAASQLQLSDKGEEGHMLFWTSAPQNSNKDENGNATFAWSDTSKNVVMKLGEADIGTILNFLNSKKGEVSLFHENNRGNTSMKMGVWERGYNVKLGSKTKENGVVQISHSLSPGEGAVLKVLLEEALLKMYNW